MAAERVQRRIERLLDQLDEAESQGNWESVRDLAQDVLEIDPDNTEAGAYLRSSGRRLEAVTATPNESPSSAPPSSPIVSDRQAPQPTSFANGRYQVKRFLGEGGKKKVYLAHDTTLDREVAFALIKTDGLDETSRIRIQREAQAMGRLGSHSHIVTVFDLGEEQDQPYMVTELMGGGDVEGVIEDSEDHRLPLEQAIKIAQETCRGMEFAHSRGIVHRDLKPGNVWLTTDGIAKIGDFGLAVSLDRSRLTTEGMLVGTVSYMPPEQAMGGEVTPRSDLYSLGAMLYEMVTGRPPFLGDDSVAIIGQHINTPPVAPTWHNGECPRALDALILRLLAKDPSERPESATDVLSALDAIDLNEATPLVKGDEGISDPHALDSLAGGVFVGRQQEMGDLKACLEDALSGRGRLVTLVGEPGIGKSRTAQELATYAGLRHAQVLWGRCYEGEGAPPYWPWVQAIRSYVRESEPDELRSEMGAGAADIAGIVSDVSEKLPGLAAPPELEPEQARFRLFDSMTAFLKSASQRQPLVLVLDDLHWADQPSLALLQFVTRELSGARLLIIGTYRDMELSRQHPLAEALGELTRERLFQRVLLRGLTQEDVGRFIEVTSGHNPPPGLIEAVHTQTEGNPLFVTEVVRLLVQEGALTPDPSPSGRGETEGRGEGNSWTIRIPEGVREVIGRRLNRLSQRCNQVLTVASIGGREFTMSQLRPLVKEVTEDSLFEILEEALASRVIEELPQTVGRYQFTHALIQETLAGELSTTRKVRLHAQIAQAFEELYGTGAEAEAAELAYHYSEAEAMIGPEKSVHYCTIAGQKALDEYAFEEALSYFQRAVAAMEERPTDREGADRIFGLGRAQAAMLRMGDARASLTHAFDHYVEVGNIDSAVAVAEYPTDIGNTGVPALVVRALELVPPDSHAFGRLISQFGYHRGQRNGDDQAAQESFDQALTIAQREGNQVLEMWTLARAGNVGISYLRPRECLLKHGQAIELNTGIGDPDLEVVARDCVVTTLMSLGDLAEAEAQSEAMIHYAERSRYRSGLLTALSHAAIPALFKGDWATTRNLTDQGLQLDPDDQYCLTLRAMVEYMVGESDAGAPYLARFIEVMPLSGLSWYVQTIVPLIAYIIGDTQYLDAIVDAARSALSSSSLHPRGAWMVNITLALAAVLDCDQEKARSLYSDIQPVLADFPAEGHICISMDRLLGLLAHTMADPDRANDHFEDATTFCRQSGYRPELAWTLCDYADMLLERNEKDDRAKAMSLLDESLAISSELGMRPPMERVLSRREILKA